MKSIQEVISNVTNQSKELRQAKRIAQLVEVWNKSVQEPLRSHAQPWQLNGDTLVLEVSTSVWATQINFLTQQLIGLLGEQLPEIKIAKIRTTVGNGKTIISPPNNSSTRQQYLSVTTTTPTSEFLNQAGIAPLQRIIAKDETYKQEVLVKQCSICGRRAKQPVCPQCLIQQRESRYLRIAVLLTQEPWLDLHQCERRLDGCNRTDYWRARKRCEAKWKDQINGLLFLQFKGYYSPSEIEKLKGLVNKLVSLKAETPISKITEELKAGILGQRKFRLYQDIVQAITSVQ